MMLVCCAVFFSFSVSANHMTLKRAMSSKLVSVNAVGNGGACGKCIKLELANNTKTELELDVDPALIFVPEDTTYQNLVLLGNETIALAPNSCKEFSLQTFCGKSYASCPRIGLHYKFWRQGDSGLIKTLTFVKENNMAMNLAQRAVWVFTNGKCINTVYSSIDPRMSETLVKYIASLKNTRMPDYFVEHQLNERPGQVVLVPNREKVFVTMHWGAEDGYRHMRLSIFKENGEIYREVEANQIIDKIGFTVQVAFDPRVDPKGTYFVQLHDDANRVWDQKKIVVGVSDCELQLFQNGSGRG
jgi:hypothetical protein